jgi:hypothetical protein
MICEYYKYYCMYYSTLIHEQSKTVLARNGTTQREMVQLLYTITWSSIPRERELEVSVSVLVHLYVQALYSVQ